VQASQLGIKVSDLKAWFEVCEHQKQVHKGFELRCAHKFDENNLVLECAYTIEDLHNTFLFLYSNVIINQIMYLALLPFDDESGSITPSSFVIVGQS